VRRLRTAPTARTRIAARLACAGSVFQAVIPAIRAATNAAPSAKGTSINTRSKEPGRRERMLTKTRRKAPKTSGVAVLARSESVIASSACKRAMQK
jgi:hypothetical protein